MNQYYYLIASLPMLAFGMKMPFSYSDFISLCREHLSVSDMEIIKRTSIAPCEDVKDPLKILKEWKIFDTAIRNEIARSRAIKKAKDIARYIHHKDYLNPFIADVVHWAVNQDSPLEVEASLDRFRWEKLEELGKGHYFDINFLIIYALELQILERWERINSEGGMQVLQDLLTRGNLG